MAELISGDENVLTFFDYLRQRAFESVLAGARDALDVLERQKSLRPPDSRSNHVAEVQDDEVLGSPRKRVEVKSESAAPAGDDKPLPPPRDRGRPAKQQDKQK